LEKLKLPELSTREAVMEAARMLVPVHLFMSLLTVNHSIYLVHDDAKEKDFELEMSWIGDETGGVHLPVPKELRDEAEQKAKAALENFD